MATSNFNDLLSVLKSGDEGAFVRIVESEALNLHAMFLTSSPGYILMHPGTLAIIDKIRKYRNATGTFLCFTLDAGPNVHLVYPRHLRVNIREFIKSELLQWCENARWIDDEIGNGPVLLQH
jgi:diphosphomevalonate decarboxylase